MLEIIRGDSVKLEFKFSDIDGKPIDLTNGDIFFTVKKDAKDLDSEAVIKKDFAFSGDGKDGIVEIELESSETEIDTGVYSYDVQIKNKDGYIMSSQVEKLLVKGDITRRNEMSI